MKIKRQSIEQVRNGLKQFPAVVLTGARQVGKTTLAHALQEQYAARFFDLENPAHALSLQDPLSVLREHQDTLVIIDEAQRQPELFPVLRVLIDEHREAGRFLLLGSATPDLRRQCAESLAGRTMNLELPPLTVEEVVPGYGTVERLWERGGLPPSFLASGAEQSLRWREEYLRSVTERDLRLLGFDLPPARLTRFLQMLAHNHGQLWNASQLARSLDIGATTAGRYLDAIEQTYLVRRLLPFSTNLGKRLIKAPKVYIRDSGLLHALLGIRDRSQRFGHPVGGFSWEGFVLEQFCAVLGPGWTTAFWRTAAGAEIDLLLLCHGQPRIAVEMKMNASNPKPVRGFHQGCEDLGLRERWVVYPGNEALLLTHNTRVLPVAAAVARLRQACDAGQTTVLERFAS